MHQPPRRGLPPRYSRRGLNAEEYVAEDWTAVSRAVNQRMDELKNVFGLTDEDLNIDLGPLGRLR